MKACLGKQLVNQTNLPLDFFSFEYGSWFQSMTTYLVWMVTKQAYQSPLSLQVPNLLCIDTRASYSVGFHN